MTDREKLIELLVKDPCYFEFGPCRKCRYYAEPACYPPRMADHLLANGVTFTKDTDVPSKWISVDDRLPEEGEVVMCRHKARQYPVFCQWDESDLCWVNNSWTFGRGLITHWMPLPEPPED